MHEPRTDRHRGQKYGPSARASSARKHAERKGRLAENLAALFLTLKGYRILERRWKSKTGEIDLIARKGQTLVFVEVKSRQDHAAAREAVTWQSRRRIERTASGYLSRKRLQPMPPCRFDVVTVSGVFLQHHKDAWREGE